MLMLASNIERISDGVQPARRHQVHLDHPNRKAVMTYISSERPPERAGGTNQTAVVTPAEFGTRPSEVVEPLHFYAFYGTLMSSPRWPAGVCFAGVCFSGGEPMGRSHGPCTFLGEMYQVGQSFPALLPGENTCHGELWEVRPEYALLAQEKLDTIESYFPGVEAHSMYLRRRVRLLEPDVDAWVYVWNKSRAGLVPLPDGRWEGYSR